MSYQKPTSESSFTRRLDQALRADIAVGDYLHGSWPRGASVRLPPSGDGGRAHDYARQGHPGGEKIESILQTLEMGKHALCFSDGMRAIQAATECVVRPGDVVFVNESLYGGTLRYFNKLKEWGVNVRFVDLNADLIGQGIFEEKPKLIVLESVTNPLLEVPNMPELMRAAARVGSYMIIDNTLATGYACLPLDIARQNEYQHLMVALSITKGYTAGILGGAVVLDNDELAHKLFEERRSCGGNASPNDVPLYYDGLKTMGVRMERLSESAYQLAQTLSMERPTGIGVLYPLLPESHSYPHAQELLLAPPGVVTLECKLSPEQYSTLIERLEEIFVRSNSFNSVQGQLSESLKQSHASVREQATGISSQLIRLSPGTTLTPEELTTTMRLTLLHWDRRRVYSKPSAPKGPKGRLVRLPQKR